VGRVIPVSITLKNLLEKNFAEEYAARRAEEGPAPSPADNAPLPLFVMACILPGARSEASKHRPAMRVFPWRYSGDKVMSDGHRIGFAQQSAGYECRVSHGPSITWHYIRPATLLQGSAHLAIDSCSSCRQASTICRIQLIHLLVPSAGEKMALNIFEPRYRLMVRRCMEGSRRLGMAVVTTNDGLHEVATECEIVECQPLPDGCAILSLLLLVAIAALASDEAAV